MRAVLIFTASLFALGLSACKAQEPDPASKPLGTVESARDPSGARGQSLRGPGGVKQASAAGIKALDKTKFGEPITENTTTSLPTILKAPAQYTNKTVRTEGMVSAVCQAMGCWMQIADESGKAHIKMAGHSFFVPKESSGHRAVVQGKVTGSNAQNACAEGDGCGNQEVTQVQIEATGVEFVD